VLFFRVLQHLLPRGSAWSLTVQKTLRDFFLGLAEQPTATKTFIDEVYEDLHPETTRYLAEWEKQFGLAPAADAVEADRRLALAAEWAATGGQSPRYIEDVLQTAGFDVYVHEWWDPGTGDTRDPRDYTNQPLIGIYQCTGDDEFGYPFASQPQCSAFASQPQCNGFLANDTFYLVNKDLTRRAPPRVPDDPETWPYFLYIGAEDFPGLVAIDPARRSEFERLILKLRPTHNWIVELIDWGSGGGAEGGLYISTEDLDHITTESGDSLIT
jgi:hypothetical protein